MTHDPDLIVAVLFGQGSWCVPKWRDLRPEARRNLDGLVLWTGPVQFQTGRLFVRARLARLAHP